MEKYCDGCMDLVKLIEQQAEVIKRLQDRLAALDEQVSALPGESVALVSYVNSTLAAFALFNAAEHDHALRDYMVASCAAIPACGNLDENAVREAFETIKKGILEHEDKPFRPDWFRGVIAGGKIKDGDSGNQN